MTRRVRHVRGFLVVAALCASTALTGCAQLGGANNTPGRTQRPTAFYKSGIAKTSIPEEKERERALDPYLRGKKRAVAQGPRVGDVREAPLEPRDGAIAAPPSKSLDRAFDDPPEMLKPPKPTAEPEVVDAAEAPRRDVYHVVKSGDTLGSVSRQYDVPVATLRKWNEKEVAQGLPAGCTLYVPGAHARKSAPVAGIPSGAKPEKLASFRPTKETRFAWPIQGALLSKFGMRSGRLHTGIDIAGDQGTPIHAAMAGKVIFAGQMNGYGNVVILDHLNGYFTVYGHNAQNLVTVDRTGPPRIIPAGQVIARVGQTGNATRPHVHFEIRRSNDALDPLPLLKQAGAPVIAATKLESRRG